MPPPLPAAAAGRRLLPGPSALRLRLRTPSLRTLRTLTTTTTPLRTLTTTPLRLPHQNPRQPKQPNQPPSHNRPYHSPSHPPGPGPFTPPETLLLTHAYAHVRTSGFTPTSLALGARAAGLLDISATILPQGVFSLILFHLATQREALAATKLEGTTTTERVEELTWARLRGNVDAGVVGSLQEALAIMAQPSYAPSSVRELALLSDEIWYLAGDVAVDPSWYTKRASLAGIYAAAELFMTNDRSEGFRETREFLRRRLAEAGEIGDVTRSVREWLSFTASAGVNVLRSKGVPV
ncbi:COQ9-domain-containing protein [Podospora conica]|nr:COQ9-domain-containing protein [Schizothecium conicum]